jgi:hypothetical protein
VEAAHTPRRDIDAGRVIGEAFDIYKNNFGALVGVGLIVFIVAGILEGLLSEIGTIGSLLGTIVRLVALALFTGFVVKLVDDVRDGRRDFSVGDLISSATPYIATLIVVGFLWGLGVGIGLLLLIVPGVILATFWSVALPSVVAEDRGVFDSFGRSMELVRGNAGNVFITILLTLLIVLGVYLVASIIGAAIGLVALVIFAVIAGALTAPIWALVVSVLFFDLGGGKQREVAAPTPPPPPPPPPPAPTA